MITSQELAILHSQKQNVNRGIFLVPTFQLLWQISKLLQCNTQRWRVITANHWPAALVITRSCHHDKLDLCSKFSLKWTNKIKTKLKKRSTQINSKHICLQARHISERWSKCGHRKCWYTLRLPSLKHTQYLALNVRTGLCCLVLYFNKSLAAGWQPNNQRKHYAVYIEGLQVLQLFPRSTQLVIDSLILPFFGYSM